MKPATELIHVAEGVNEDAAPLTTPIYETTTYVFENAQEVLDYNEGRSPKFLYSRYANPTVVAVEKKIAALEGAASALVFSSGQAATTTALMALLLRGDEVVCSAAIYGGTFHLIADLLPKFGIKSRFVSIDDLRQPDAVLFAVDQTGLVRVADQPDAALRRHRGGRRGVPRARRHFGARQHVREPDQSAAAGARRRCRDAQRDEVPQRPQRRDGRRAGRAERADRQDAVGAQARRARSSIPTPPTRSAEG